MSDTNQSAKKTLFIGSELRPALGRTETADTPHVASSATNQDIQTAAIKALEMDGTLSCASHEPNDWEAQKHDVLHCAEDVHCTILEGEAVLLNLDNGHYYSLNKVGTAIWECCDGSRTLQDVLMHICERFEVMEDQARKDLLIISSQLIKESLLLQSKA